MKRATLALALGLSLALAACGKDSANTSVAAETSAAATETTGSAETTTATASDAATETTVAATDAAATEPCPDDGPRFPGTGLCTGRISNYIDPARLPEINAPEGCEWTFNETMMIDQALIYRALSCKGVTTQLEFSAGAQTADLTYVTSALGYENTEAFPLVKVFVSDPAAPQAVIASLKNDLPAEEQAKCIVRSANIDGWPTDAVVLAYNDADTATLPTDEPNAVCGPYGLDEDTQNYWIVRNGYAFFFQLGQDDTDIDPGSFTVLTKYADGTWGEA